MEKPQSGRKPLTNDAFLAELQTALTKVADRLTLGACVKSLFDKVCLTPKETSYGAWSGTTLRLVGENVQQAGRDGVFRDLVRQRQPGCALPITD